MVLCSESKEDNICIPDSIHLVAKSPYPITILIRFLKKVHAAIIIDSILLILGKTVEIDPKNFNQYDMEISVQLEAASEKLQNRVNFIHLLLVMLCNLLV